jgi:hypothetical protein
MNTTNFTKEVLKEMGLINDEKVTLENFKLTSRYMSKFVTDLIEGKELLNNGTLKNSESLKKWILNEKAPNRFSERKRYFDRVAPIDIQLRLNKVWTNLELRDFIKESSEPWFTYALHRILPDYKTNYNGKRFLQLSIPDGKEVDDMHEIEDTISFNASALTPSKLVKLFHQVEHLNKWDDLVLHEISSSKCLLAFLKGNIQSKSGWKWLADLTLTLYTNYPEHARDNDLYLRDVFLTQFLKHKLDEHEVIPFLKKDVELPTDSDDYGKIIQTLSFSTYLGIELPHEVNLELIRLLEIRYLDRFNEHNPVSKFNDVSYRDIKDFHESTVFKKLGIKTKGKNNEQ